jgi:hypothetical protein
MTTELNEAERALMDCYRSLAAVLGKHGDQLAPFEKRNAIKALGALWQIANGLDQDPGQIYELGA